MPHLPQFLQSEKHQLGLLALCATVAVGVTCYRMLRRRPDPVEIERRRRLFLAEHGRITDASLIDSSLGEAGASVLAAPRNDQSDEEGPPPTVLLYHYRVSGVTYESAQDVTLLPDLVRHVRVDLPVQVRYDPHNPTNSIVVSEAWTGLRLDPDSDPFDPPSDPHLRA